MISQTLVIYQNRGHLSSYPVLNRTNWFFPLPSKGKLGGEERAFLCSLFYAFLEINGEGLGLVSLSLDWRGRSVWVRGGTAWKNNPSSSWSPPRTRWIGPGEQLWFSVPPKCVPHPWQVLGAGAALSSCGGSQTQRSRRRERTQERLQGYRGGGTGRKGAGLG